MVWPLLGRSHQLARSCWTRWWDRPRTSAASRMDRCASLTRARAAAAWARAASAAAWSAAWPDSWRQALWCWVEGLKLRSERIVDLSGRASRADVGPCAAQLRAGGVHPCPLLAHRVEEGRVDQRLEVPACGLLGDLLAVRCAHDGAIGGVADAEAPSCVAHRTDAAQGHAVSHGEQRARVPEVLGLFNSSQEGPGLAVVTRDAEPDP